MSIINFRTNLIDKNVKCFAPVRDFSRVHMIFLSLSLPCNVHSFLYMLSCDDDDGEILMIMNQMLNNLCIVFLLFLIF